MKHYQVTERARNDLRSNGRYTAAVWGAKKRDRYLHRLVRRFQRIAENPKLGTPRPDIHEDYFCYPDGEHLIFYMMIGEVPAIIGIPHKRMDIISHFRR